MHRHILFSIAATFLVGFTAVLAAPTRPGVDVGKDGKFMDDRGASNKVKDDDFDRFVDHRVAYNKVKDEKGRKVAKNGDFDEFTKLSEAYKKAKDKVQRLDAEFQKMPDGQTAEEAWAALEGARMREEIARESLASFLEKL
ncbi:hypothetical protein FRC03_001371 [Tulasnella sp. 419]|nr:hypothetical protein FRC03_001371 [Tulasnella sp. 419]